MKEVFYKSRWHKENNIPATQEEVETMKVLAKLCEYLIMLGVFAFVLTILYWASVFYSTASAKGLRFDQRAPMHGELTFGNILSEKLDTFTINVNYEPKYILSHSADFIASHEGFRHCAYPDLGGGWSIGYATISHEGECISEPVARKRLESLVWNIQNKVIIPRLGKIPPKDMVVLTDVVYSVRPQNYEYIFKQYEIADSEKRKKELTYALSRMQYAWTPMSRDECVATSNKRGYNQIVYDEHGRCRLMYGGLRKRFLARIDLLFA